MASIQHAPHLTLAPDGASDGRVKQPQDDLSRDRAWLDGFRRGDAEALERVVRVYAPYAVVILRRGFMAARGGYVQPVLDPDAQHELLQEVFVRVLSPQVRERYDGLRPFSIFLRGVVGNVMLEDARRQQKAIARAADLDEISESDAWMPGTPLPDQAAISQEERAFVQDYLATLTPEERQFVVVRFQERNSQRDTAEALGMARHVVRALDEKIRDGLRAFQQQWKRKSEKRGPEA